jgi:hypothetical protein
MHAHSLPAKNLGLFRHSLVILDFSIFIREQAIIKKYHKMG